MKHRFSKLSFSLLCLCSLFGCDKSTSKATASNSPNSVNSNTDKLTDQETNTNTRHIVKEYTPETFNKAIANYKVNFTNDIFSLDFFGTEAIYNKPISDMPITGSGYIHLEDDQSVWEFSFDENNTFELGSVLYGKTSTKIDFLESLDRYKALNVLISDDNGQNWEESDEDNTYITDDEDTITAYLALGGYINSSIATYTASSLTMTTTEDDVTISGNVTRTDKNGDTKNIDFSLVATNIGTNDNASLSEFLYNPVIPEVNDFDPEFKEEMISLAGFCFTYDSKLTKYCYFDDSDDYLYYEDHRSGNVISDFETQLINNGFTKDDTKTTLYNGAESYTYTKVLSEITDTKGQITAEVTLQYCPKSYYDITDNGEYSGLYEDGLFMIRVKQTESLFYTDLSMMNTFLQSKYKKDDGTSLIPMMNFTDLQSIKMVDQMSIVGRLGNIESNYKISGKFNTNSGALSALQAWGESLVANGINFYTNTGTRPAKTYKPLSETNLETFYKYTDSSNPNVMIDLEVFTDKTSGELNGEFAITIEAKLS